jgi:4-amino-4-deoxy-L-arabinose transferase-like glycosyltransferase
MMELHPGRRYNIYMRSLRWIFLGIIIVTAIAVRFYRINEVPMGLNYDEASIAYNAWSISIWHRDEFANFLPLSFRSFGDYKPPLIIYLLALPDLLTGLWIGGVRVLSALSGVGSVLITYFIAGEIQSRLVKIHPSQWFKLIPTLLMALSPWSVTLSRVGFEQNTAFFLVNIGIYSLLRGLRQPKWLLYSTVPIAASLYTFHTAKIFWLGFLLLIGYLYRKELKHKLKWLKYALAGLALMMLPLAFDTFLGAGGARAATLIFFQDNHLTSVTNIGNEFFNNIGHQLSWQFWINGYDSVSLRHSVPHHGVVTWPEFGLLIIGFMGMWFILPKKNCWLMSGWFVMGLMPAILTHQTPHTLRSLFALTPTVIIVTLGLWGLLKAINRYLKIKGAIAGGILVGLSYGISVASYLNAYYTTYKIDSATAFQYGYQQVFADLPRWEQNTDKIVMTDTYGQPYIYALLYNAIRPQQFIFGALNKYEFRSIKWPESTPNRIYVGSPAEIPPSDPTVVETIKIPGTEQILWVIAKT